LTSLKDKWLGWHTDGEPVGATAPVLIQRRLARYFFIRAAPSGWSRNAS